MPGMEPCQRELWNAVEVQVDGRGLGCSCRVGTLWLLPGSHRAQLRPKVLGMSWDCALGAGAIFLREFSLILLEVTALAPSRGSPACPLLMESPALQILGKRS